MITYVNGKNCVGKTQYMLKMANAEQIEGTQYYNLQSLIPIHITINNQDVLFYINTSKKNQIKKLQRLQNDVNYHKNRYLQHSVFKYSKKSTMMNTLHNMLSRRIKIRDEYLKSISINIFINNITNDSYMISQLFMYLSKTNWNIDNLFVNSIHNSYLQSLIGKLFIFIPNKSIIEPYSEKTYQEFITKKYNPYISQVTYPSVNKSIYIEVRNNGPLTIC